MDTRRLLFSRIQNMVNNEEVFDMTNERILQLLKIERECVKRNGECDRDCANCDLVQIDSDLIEMYDNAIEHYQKIVEGRD